MSTKQAPLGCRMFGEMVTEDLGLLIEADAVLKYLVDALDPEDDTIRWTKASSNFMYVTRGGRRQGALLVGFARRWVERYPELSAAKGYAIVTKLHKILRDTLMHTVKELKASGRYNTLEVIGTV